MSKIKKKYKLFIVDWVDSGADANWQTEEQAKKALEETKDIAEAILRLSK